MPYNTYCTSYSVQLYMCVCEGACVYGVCVYVCVCVWYEHVYDYMCLELLLYLYILTWLCITGLLYIYLLL